MPEPVSELVRRQAAERYSPELAATALDLLGSTRLPFLETPSRDRDRVHLAILLYSRGQDEWLRDAVALAAADWRDLLVAAGMESEGWPAVLRDSGFVAP